MGGISSSVQGWVDCQRVCSVGCTLDVNETDNTATSTGTTIVGVKFGGGSSGEEEGVCLGADTRATGGSIVADKNCEKVSFGSLWPRPS
jgi:20S proteasome alpha/beta subunit